MFLARGEKEITWRFLYARANVPSYLWQVPDVHLHVAALAGSVQPLHVHVERPAARRDTSQRDWATQREKHTHTLTAAYLLAGT